jgi:hypothetical protein
MAGGPEADGTSLKNYIESEKKYTDWPLWPGTKELYEGTQPHGAYLTTYVNEQAKESIEKKSGELEDGSIVVKENYSQEKKLAAVTVMFKKTGYDPNHGDWFYLKYTADGAIESEGKVNGCISCHAKAKDNDWLFTSKIK